MRGGEEGSGEIDRSGNNHALRPICNIPATFGCLEEECRPAFGGGGWLIRGGGGGRLDEGSVDIDGAQRYGSMKRPYQSLAFRCTSVPVATWAKPSEGYAELVETCPHSISAAVVVVVVEVVEVVEEVDRHEKDHPPTTPLRGHTTGEEASGVVGLVAADRRESSTGAVVVAGVLVAVDVNTCCSRRPLPRGVVRYDGWVWMGWMWTWMWMRVCCLWNKSVVRRLSRLSGTDGDSASVAAAATSALGGGGGVGDGTGSSVWEGSGGCGESG